MLDLAQHYDEGPVQISNIAKRQDISVKYLEQLIIPLKKVNFIKSFRGPKGGHMLTKSPEEITVGEKYPMSSWTIRHSPSVNKSTFHIH